MKYSTLAELRILNQITETNVSEITQTLNQNFEKGLISEELCENSFKELDDLIEKAGNHKYFKREGSPGNYKYYYTEAEYKEAKGERTPQKESKKEPKSTSTFDWNSGDAKILAKFGITKDNLEVGGNLGLKGTKITSLPDNLKVGGYLDLEGAKITSLPDNLEVGGGLDLEGAKITSLPDNLKVGGYLDLKGTKIKRSDFKDSMEIKGKIYLDKEENTTKHNFA